MNDVLKKIALIASEDVADLILEGDCRTCENKGGSCDECFEGCYYSPKETSIVKILNKHILKAYKAGLAENKTYCSYECRTKNNRTGFNRNP